MKEMDDRTRDVLTAQVCDNLPLSRRPPELGRPDPPPPAEPVHYLQGPDGLDHEVSLTPMKSGGVGCSCGCNCMCCVTTRMTDDQMYHGQMRDAIEHARQSAIGWSPYPLTDREQELIRIANSESWMAGWKDSKHDEP